MHTKLSTSPAMTEHATSSVRSVDAFLPSMCRVTGGAGPLSPQGRARAGAARGERVHDAQHLGGEWAGKRAGMTAGPRRLGGAAHAVPLPLGGRGTVGPTRTTRWAGEDAPTRLLTGFPTRCRDEVRGGSGRVSDVEFSEEWEDVS
jgi:hypothetical protein